jgi:hypothetical protein
VEILANALPGFRDLRGPVFAGYIWLFFAWLLVAPDLDHRPDGGLAAAAYDLADDIGRVGIVVTVSVAAYLVGSVSQQLSSLLRQGWVRWAWRLPRWAQGGAHMAHWGHRGGDVSRRGPPSWALHQRGRRIIEERLGPVDPAKPAPAVQTLLEDLESRASETDSEVAREIALPATLLVGERPQLFAEVDRLRAEGELRLAVAPPIVALNVLLVIEGSLWWLLALPAALVLFVQGIRRDSDSKKVIADAIQLGRVESSSLSGFAQWVDALPDEIERRQLAAAKEPARVSSR